jgi:hypothetical protein
MDLDVINKPKLSVKEKKEKVGILTAITESLLTSMIENVNP